jgi:hypothetical protein
MKTQALLDLEYEILVNMKAELKEIQDSLVRINENGPKTSYEWLVSRHLLMEMENNARLNIDLLEKRGLAGLLVRIK